MRYIFKVITERIFKTISKNILKESAWRVFALFMHQNCILQTYIHYYQKSKGIAVGIPETSDASIKVIVFKKTSASLIFWTCLSWNWSL